MQAAEVILKDVGKCYGDQWVVRDVDLHIQRGQFFTFLGPSGCGKTTLLRMIAGFVWPDEGTVYLDGRPVNQVPPWQRDVGMVFQNYALWPHMSVFENIAFGLRERKVPRREIEGRVAEALAQVELRGTEMRRPSQLSGGQQQRVALARTLVIQPKVLLLDEPLSNLDAKLRVEMRLELLKLQRGLGLTTVYVTHDQEEALAMSTQIAVLKDGRVIQEGNPRDIYEQPVNDFVAGFVGQANLLSGKVSRCEESYIDVDTNAGLIIRLARPKRLPPPETGANVFLTVRPEAMELKELESAGGELNQAEGEIIASVYRGSSIEYEIRALGKTLKAHRTNPKGKRAYQQGERVIVCFSPEDVIWVPQA